ncbi:uncharacterized protein TRIADDRAFT_58426 [Trichoplax adhaerens]|uniref:RBPJ-interacting and tubulin-associated protein 1 n=1 Tax=Trichoplax adhaerens TaxID=10228 RepID=B3S297_TRIAD|nr:predicted protein [Trichoplax adhaerens]EDV23293.1 predicted protein [Trichoplax adhaerens]|eukprot:XP_002114203.1 predicted protein [Trichoplax adhaerens]
MSDSIARRSGNNKRRNIYKSRSSYVDESLFDSANKSVSFHEVKFDPPWIKNNSNRELAANSLAWNKGKAGNDKKSDRERVRPDSRNLKRPYRKQVFKSSFTDDSLFGDPLIAQEQSMRELPPWGKKEKGKYMKPLLWDPDPSNIRIEGSRSSRDARRPDSVSGSFSYSRSSTRTATYGVSSARRPQSATVRPPWR